MGCSTRFRIGGNLPVRIECPDGTVALLEDTASFFKKWFDVLDEFFFVQLFLWSALSFFDMLEND